MRTRNAEYFRKWYHKNAENRLKHVKRVKSKTAVKRDYVKRAKNRPCADCGILYPYYVMQFDHLGNKAFTISEASSYDLQRIKDEIKKCDVVCANCHAERTHTRRVN